MNASSGPISTKVLAKVANTGEFPKRIAPAIDSDKQLEGVEDPGVKCVMNTAMSTIRGPFRRSTPLGNDVELMLPQVVVDMDELMPRNLETSIDEDRSCAQSLLSFSPYATALGKQNGTHTIRE